MTGDPKTLRAVVAARDARDNMRRRGDELLANAIRSALDDGWSLRNIAKALEISHVMVQKHLKRTT